MSTLRKLPRPLAASAAFLLVSLVSARAQIATDGHVGPAITVGKVGNNFALPDALGTKIGGNLFHSFSQFNLSSGEVATFSGPSDVSNILARVTGGSASSIDGTIRSTINGANLFLINPKGIVLGPNAALDVSGAVTLSSADYVKLGTNGRFGASNPADDILTASPVSAFGFLGATQPITISGSQLTANGGFSAVGGNVTLNNSARLTTNGGKVVLASAAAKGELDVTGAPIAAIKPRVLGNVQLNRATIDASGATGGAIEVRAARFTSDRANLLSDTTGPGTGGTMNLRARSAIEIKNGSLVRTGTRGAGTAGMVNAQAASISVAQSSLLGSRAFDTTTAAAKSGQVRIRAGRLAVLDEGTISASTLGRGKGSLVDVDAQSIRIVGTSSGLPTGILSNTNFATDGGPGGNVKVKTNSLNITRGGQIRADTAGRGAGGSVEVTANQIYLNAQGATAKTGIFADTLSGSAGAGKGGSVNVKGGTVKIVDGGLISTKTLGPGGSGDTRVTADELYISRGASTFFTGIAADSPVPNGGPGGSVIVDASRVSILSGGQISSNTFSHSPGGSVTVHADQILIIGRSDIFSAISADSSFLGAGAGRGGDVRVTTDFLDLRRGGRISANTFGSGAGGDVEVFAREGIFRQGASNLFTGLSAESSSLTQPGTGGNVRATIAKLTLDGGGVIANTAGPGAGGDLMVISDFLNIIHGGRISADTSGLGAGGRIDLQAGRLTISGAGTDSATGIFSRSLADGFGGPGGTVTVEADEVRLKEGALIGASSTSSGAGGSVALRARKLAMKSEATIAASATGGGGAGSVRIEVIEPLTLDGNSNVSTTSEISDSGTVEIYSKTDIFLRNSNLTVRATQGNAGRIALFAPRMISLWNSAVLAEAGLNGGDVFIDPQYVLLTDSRISANAILGAGGNIGIIADSFLATNSAVTASSEASVQGTVRIETLQGDISGALVSLSSAFVSAKTNLQERCAMRLGGDYSTFLVVGRGGVAPAPDEPIPLLPAPVTAPAPLARKVKAAANRAPGEQGKTGLAAAPFGRHSFDKP